MAYRKTSKRGWRKIGLIWAGRFTMIGNNPQLCSRIKLKLCRKDWEKIFMPCLRGVSNVMTEQLELARVQGLEVHVRLYIFKL